MNKLSLTLSKPDRKSSYLLPYFSTNEYQDVQSSELSSSSVITGEDIFQTKALLVGKKESEHTRFTLHLKHRIMSPAETFSPKGYTREQKKYLISDSFINANDNRVKTIIKKNEDEENGEEILEACYRYVLESLTYGNLIRDLHSFDQALRAKVTDCGGFSTLLCSLLQAHGIPTRLVVGYIVTANSLRKLLSSASIITLSESDLFMHAWAEALLPDNTWFPMDPSIEWKRIHGKSRREGGFGFIPADRIVVSFGRNIIFKVANKEIKFPIFQHPEPI